MAIAERSFEVAIRNWQAEGEQPSVITCNHQPSAIQIQIQIAIGKWRSLHPKSCVTGNRYMSIIIILNVKVTSSPSFIKEESESISFLPFSSLLQFYLHLHLHLHLNYRQYVSVSYFAFLRLVSSASASRATVEVDYISDSGAGTSHQDDDDDDYYYVDVVML